jgi:endoglucanase
MTDHDFAFLKELLEAPSPSGYEAPARNLLRRKLESVADHLEVDMLGNLIVSLIGEGEGRPRLMLTAHYDEIGFLIRYIDDRGFLYFAPVGGVDAHLVPGQRVSIQTAAGPLRGVVGKKPIHQMDAKDKERVVPFGEQFIDIGCQDGAEARELVAVGDPVVFAAGLERLRGERITCRALDDKMGAWLVCQAFLELAAGPRPAADIFAVFTVQEEIGLRGAGPGAYGVNPDVAFAVEIGHGTDTPAHDPKSTGESKLGHGPLISRGPNINHALFELIKKTAGEIDIPLQVIGEPRGTGTDANVIQLTRNGVATALIRVPTRYVHTPSEVLDLRDLQQAGRLLVEASRRIARRSDFIPN